MDMLVVAAAAGAGCLAKYWRETLREKGLQSGTPASAFTQLQNSGAENFEFSSPFDESCSREIVAGAERSAKSDRNQKQFSDSSGEPEALSGIDEFNDGGPLSLGPDSAMSNIHRKSDEIASVQDHILQGMRSMNGVQSEYFLPLMRHKGNGYSYFPGADTEDRGSFEIDDSIEGIDCAKRESPDLHETGNMMSQETSPRLADGRQRFGRNKSTLHRRWSHGFSLKPMTALESCLVAQMYKDPIEMEENICGSPVSSSVRALQPFVAEGNGVSVTTTEQLGVVQNDVDRTWFRNGFDSAERHRTLTGIPPLPAIESKTSRGKEKNQKVKFFHGKTSGSSTRPFAKDSHVQGSIDGALLFSFGIGVGVMSAVISNKREVDRLNDLLKQTENLVQDLQEELEMKDTLTVNELAREPSPSGRNDHTGNKKMFKSFVEKAPDDRVHDTGTRHESQKFGNDPDESMKKIEAELEAELERLELNMSSFSHKRSLSGLTEIDPDGTIDIVQGELRADLLAAEPDTRETNLDASDSSPPTPRADYAVSPRELSLRLHQVLQTRLEDRIAELETALQQSQKRLELHGAENVERKPFRRTGLSSSDVSVTPVQSPTLCCRTRGQLDFQGSSTHSVSDEETSNDQVVISNPSQETFFSNDTTFKEFMRMTESKREGAQERKSRDRENTLGSLCEDQYHGEDEDDVVGGLLIKHILESKQGSLAVEHVRKMLLSLDDSL